MYPDLVKRVVIITIIVVVVSALLVVFLPGDRVENTLRVGFVILALLAAGAVTYLILLPGMYKKKLDEKGAKDLRRFVMSDPRFKGATAGKGVTRQDAEKKAAPKTEPGAESHTEHQESAAAPAAPPEDADNPFLE